MLLLCNVALAQTPPSTKPSAEEMQKGMEAAMGAMVPTMTRMAEAQIEAQLKVAEKPETAERVATFKKNLFDALRHKGFTEEQSLQITSSTPFPTANGK
jgi:hypothetical protein